MGDASGIVPWPPVVGERVAVVCGLPAGAGRPLAHVVGVGPVNVRVRMCADGTERSVHHRCIDRMDLRVDGPLVVVACGSAKQAVPSPAGELYTGSYHRACRAAASRLTRPERIRILSAACGLLPLDAVVAPYDVRAGSPGAVDGARLRPQAERQGLVGEPWVVVLGGSAYAALAREVWPHAVWPLSGTRGIGEQLARLATIARSTHPVRTAAAYCELEGRYG